ncbi:hypothetical protein [Anaerofustis stercorihominis]|uniref:hypothetical protein n=1 Tax=Anaerofustis stercorihominis TaxID=214853 RepID=UPI00110699A9|nr:hypothetical protein [Anaerofustis stercorihominis]
MNSKINLNFKKKYIPFIAIGIILILILFLTPKIAKNSMLSSVMDNQIAGKEITKIEYIKYKGEPFMSVVEEKKSISGNDNEVTKIIRSLDSYKIKILGNNESTSEILYVYFKDSTKLICYIDGNKLGVDNGNIWIKDVNIEYIKEQMKDVQIINEV